MGLIHQEKTKKATFQKSHLVTYSSKDVSEAHSNKARKSLDSTPAYQVIRSAAIAWLLKGGQSLTFFTAKQCYTLKTVFLYLVNAMNKLSEPWQFPVVSYNTKCHSRHKLKRHCKLHKNVRSKLQYFKDYEYSYTMFRFVGMFTILRRTFSKTQQLFPFTKCWKQ